MGGWHWVDILHLNQDATSVKRRKELYHSVAQSFWVQLFIQSFGEKVSEAVRVIRFGRHGLGVLVGGSATGAIKVRIDTTAKEGRLPVSPAQRMDLQSFAGMKGEELVD